MDQNLKQIYHIQKVLEDAGYFDVSRISQEIEEYTRGDDEKLQSVLKRISSNEPWEYLKGEGEFCDNKFFLDSSTLIPRIESEEMVRIAKDILHEDDYKYVLDIGTGSGCIIISLVKLLDSKKEINFIGTDINKDAIIMAKKNSLLHNTNENITFKQTNLLQDIDIDGRFLILANLPYIPTQMYLELDSSVKDFEPRIALDGGENGLRYYEELIEQIEKNDLIKYEGKLLIEIEPSTLEDVKSIVKYRMDIIKDLRGLDRFLLIHLS